MLIMGLQYRNIITMRDKAHMQQHTVSISYLSSLLAAFMKNDTHPCQFTKLL